MKYHQVCHALIIRTLTRNLHIKSKPRIRMSSFDYEDRLFSLSANGNLSELKALTSLSKTSINSSNHNGWTALMYAARNGHADVVKLLLEHGAEKDRANTLGQTALDIASFWSHHPVVSALTSLASDTPQEPVNFFTVKCLNRASELRKDVQSLKEILSSTTDTRILAFVKGFPILERNSKHYKLRMFKLTELKEFIDMDQFEILFLGKSVQDVGDFVNGAALFAVELSKEQLDKLLSKFTDDNLLVLEKIRDAFILDAEQAALAGLAHSLFDWHTRYKFCPSCGHLTQFSDAGYKRQCKNESCLSVKEIKNTSYPRLDPTIIVAVTSSDRSRLLLARGHKFMPNMWSCIAGFMEPGESIEDACRREVMEESGVTVGPVSYHSSQPWPFPTQLMVGLVGQASTDIIKVDKTELADARWFTRQEVVKMMMKSHPEGYFVPPHQAIAHRLIKSFLNERSSKI